MDDLFDKIIAGEIPSTKVYEDDNVFAFLDIAPNNPGHTLVIPKKHFKNLLQTPDDILGHLISIAKKIGNALVKSGLAEGINVVINNEKAAGQVVFHTHLHVIPRHNNDGHKHWKQTSYENDEEREGVAKKIRNAL